MTWAEKQARQRPALDEARRLISSGEAGDLLQAFAQMYEAGNSDTQMLVQEIKGSGERYLRAAHPWGFPAG